MPKLAHLPVLPALLAVAAAAAVGACTVNSTDNDDAAATTGDPTTTSGGGEGGSGNASSNGGAGAVGGLGTGGGTGGSSQCIGPNGTGQTNAACDDANQMPIAGAPDTCTVDGMPFTGMEEPLGLATCRRAFEVYLPGPAEFLFDELAAISSTPAEACSHTNVTNAITKMHEQACPNQTAQNACADFKAACDADGLPADTLDQAGCDFLVNPFNDTALAGWIDCANTSPADTPCDQVALDCWDLQLNP